MAHRPGSSEWPGYQERLGRRSRGPPYPIAGNYYSHQSAECRRRSQIIILVGPAISNIAPTTPAPRFPTPSMFGIVASPLQLSILGCGKCVAEVATGSRAMMTGTSCPTSWIALLLRVVFVFPTLPRSRSQSLRVRPLSHYLAIHSQHFSHMSTNLRSAQLVNGHASSGPREGVQVPTSKQQYPATGAHHVPSSQ